jgi:hypothetical protein
VATTSAVLRVRLTSTISRALPRLTAAIAQAQPTVPVPIIPIFMMVQPVQWMGVPPHARLVAYGKGGRMLMPITRNNKTPWGGKHGS